MPDLTVIQWIIATGIGFIATGTGIFVASVGYFQYRAANRKFVLDLFEKRFAIYSTVRSAVGTVTAAGKLNPQTEGELSETIERAYFFFGDDITDYLKALQTDIGNLSINAAELPSLTDPADRKKNLEEARRAKNRVFEFYRDGQPLFAKYMRFEQKP